MPHTDAGVSCTMYPSMEIYATACNDFPECVNGEDENLCLDNSALFIILPSTMGSIAFIYLVLTFWRLAYRHYKSRNEKVYSFQIHLVEEILELYSECHRKGGHDGKINSFLFHIIFTKSRDENVDICKDIYAFEEEIHNNDKCEIYCCLHKNLDPLIMEYILEIQFPGVIQKGLSYLKNIKCLSACKSH